MSELGRPFGLTFEDREEPAPLPVAPIVPAAPDIGRPFDMNFGEAVQNGGAIDAASAAAPPAAPEPVAAADGVATQPAAPQAAPNAGEPGAMSAAEMERARRLVRAEADYQRAVMEAAARLAHDDGYADLVHDIIRHKGLNTVEGYDQVDRNFLSEERDYRRAQPYDGNQRQKFMVNGDRTTASLVRGDEAAMSDTDDKLKNVGFLLERDPHGEPVKSFVNRARGAWGGVGEAAAGVVKFQAGAEVSQDIRILEEMRAVIEGTSRRVPYAGFNGRTFDDAAPQLQTVPFRPDAHTHPKVREFMEASPQDKARLYEKQRLLVEKPITENSTYKYAKGVEARFDIPADAGFEEDKRSGKELGRGLVQGAAGFSILGIPFAIASESGHRMGEAVELKGTPDQYLEVRDRATMLGMFMSLPFGKAVGEIRGVKNFGARIEANAGPGGKILLKIAEKGSEGAISGMLEGHLQDRIIKDVFDPERDTSDGALQAAIRSFANEPAPKIPQTQILTPAEVNTARARATGAFVGDFAESVRAVQHGMRISANADALSQYVDISVPNRAVAMPIAEVTRLLDSGKITPEIVKQWGVEDQVANGGTTGDIVIPLRRLMKARLAPEHIDDVARSVRLGEKTFTGHEAADFLKQRDATLGELATRMKAVKPVPDEGAFIFADASNRLRQAGWSNEEAERGAARLVESFLERVREDKNKAAKLGADGLYYREVSRREGSSISMPVNGELKQKFEAFSKVRGGTGKPAGPPDDPIKTWKNSTQP